MRCAFPPLFLLTNFHSFFTLFLFPFFTPYSILSFFSSSLLSFFSYNPPSRITFSPSSFGPLLPYSPFPCFSHLLVPFFQLSFFPHLSFSLHPTFPSPDLSLFILYSQNCITGSKVIAILLEGGWLGLLVELHRKGSAPAACTAGLFPPWFFLPFFMAFLFSLFPSFIHSFLLCSPKQAFPERLFNRRRL